MTIYGYIRQEYPEPTTEQLNKLKNYSCNEIFVEEHNSREQIELEKLLDLIKSEDQLVVSDLRVFHYGIKALKELLVYLQVKQVHLVSINEDIDTKRSLQFYSDVLAVIEMEEKQRSYLVKKNILKARSEGRIGGRPKIDKQTTEKILYLYYHKRQTIREIAEICDVSIGTVHKYVKLNTKIDYN